MVPDKWAESTLGKVSSKTISYGIVQTGEQIKGGIPCVRVIDLTRRQICREEMITTTNEIHRSYNKTKLELNEIMLALRGEIGLVQMVTKNLVGCNITRGIARISPDRKKVESDYLLWAMRSIFFRKDLLRRVNGSALKEVPLSELRKTKLLVPPKHEQTKIAKILSTWDKAIETTEKLIENSKAQKKALMQQLLTARKRFPGYSKEWATCKFKDIAALSNSRFDPKTAVVHGLCVELEHIEPNVGALKGNTETMSDSSTKAVFQKGDVLFGKLRPYLRKYWLADRSGVCSTEIWVFQAKKKTCLPSFLFFLVQTSAFIRAASVSSGSKMPRADWGYVKKASFNIPDIVEQEKLIRLFHHLDKDISIRSEDLRRLKREKSALMQQLLTGKRRVKLDKTEATEVTV